MDELHQFITKQPCYEQHVIEIKKIYESRLFSILVPNVYEGFISLYEIAQKFEQKFAEMMKTNPNVEKMSILVIFQKLLANIPNLTTHKIKGETDRIKTASRSADIFNELVKAVIKANIILMTYNVDYKRKDLIQTRYHESIVVHDFVHSCYIESARIFHSRPELFWTGYDEILINQNKRICYEIVENAIRESINLALPMKEILSEYLNNPYEMKDDIRIYVIGNPNPNTALDLEGHNLMQYPGEFNGNGEFIRKGGGIHEGDEEYMRAQDLIDRDLGVYVGGSNAVGSLLETDSEMNSFEPTVGKSNLSILLGSDSEFKGSADRDSLLEEDDEFIQPITPADTDQGGGHSDTLDSHADASHVSDASNGSSKSNNPDSVVDGIKMINLKTSMTGRGQAKTFFHEILPEANKKANAYQQKMKEQLTSSDKSVDHLKGGNSYSDKDSKEPSDQSGIKITRTTERATDHRSISDHRTEDHVSNKKDENRLSAHQTEDITTDNVEELLHGILNGKK
jgi:hypothetical protein